MFRCSGLRIVNVLFLSMKMGRIFGVFAVAAIGAALDISGFAVAGSRGQLRSVQPASDGRMKTSTVVLAWSEFGLKPRSFSCAADTQCEVTADRGRLSEAAAVFWDLTDFNIQDVPPTRPSGQLWAAQMTESPCIYPSARSPSVLGLFNLSVGMSVRADVQQCPFVPHFMLEGLGAAPMPTAEKDAFRRNGTGLVAYIQGNCVGRRDDLVAALEAEGVQVDALGLCRHNRDLPPGLDLRSQVDAPRFIDFERRYKFAIALENCVCSDYATEKLFRRLHEGVVPIYDTGPDASWLPSPGAVLDFARFRSVRELAKELKRLDADRDAYEKMLSWKEGWAQTELAAHFSKCADGYNRRERVRKGQDAQDWCPICEKVHQEQAAADQRRLTNQLSMRTLAGDEPFGVCPQEPRV